MLLLRVLSFIAFIFTFGPVALAKPVASNAIASRDAETSVASAINSLKSKTDLILPQIKSASADGDATNESVGSLVDELVAALSDTKDSLSLISPISGGLSNGTLIVLLEDLVEEIVDALGNVTGIDVSGVDLALSEIFLGLDVILLGVLTLVASLLSGFVLPLQAVGMVQTLNVLNL